MKSLGRWFVMTPALAGIFSAGVCVAQTRPATRQDWFQPQAVRPPDREPVQANSGGRDFDQPAPPQAAGAMGPQQNAYDGSDFPEDEVHDWVVANARAAHSRAIFHRAERELNESVRSVQLAFENSDDFQAAAAAEKQAYDAYTAERRKALQSVVADPKYQAIAKLRDDLATEILKLRASKEASPEQLLAMAEQKLRYNSDLRAMEADALDNDPAIKDTRQKMVQASARTTELRVRFDKSVRGNPQILTARRNLEDSRVTLITAQAYLDASLAAGATAVDFAYYRHRFDFAPRVTGGYDYLFPGYGNVGR